jgi:hypothetical protein
MAKTCSLPRMDHEASMCLSPNLLDLNLVVAKKYNPDIHTGNCSKQLANTWANSWQTAGWNWRDRHINIYTFFKLSAKN